MSEAFYLDDPEGNGVEVYADRPPESWQWTGDNLRITTDRLDVDDLLHVADQNAGYDGAPAGLRIGHIHLRVGDVAAAQRFYRGPVGLAQTAGRSGAAFMSTRRYHHHLAANDMAEQRCRSARGRSRRPLVRSSFEAVMTWKPAMPYGIGCGGERAMQPSPTGVETLGPVADPRSFHDEC